MKKIFAFTTALFLVATMMGQAPASFKYQAVLRDARGNIKANTASVITIAILQGSSAGIPVYSENHNVTTDAYGLVSLEIGNGTSAIGSISDINWATSIYYIKITVDGVEMGTGQLLSVPYALYSSKSANGFSGNYNDLTNKPPLFDGSWLSVTGKPSFATVATSGSYNDLTNKPSFFDGAWLSITGKPSFATVATSGSYNDLTNIPLLSNGTVTSVTGTSPVSVALGTSTPVISIAQANGTTNGYLSSTDWLTFNNKSTFNGTWSALTGKPVFASVATSGSYADLINVPTINGSETKVTAGANITVTGTGTTATPYIIGSSPHFVGEKYGGGIVFYVDNSGQHGLIAATADVSAYDGEFYQSNISWEYGYPVRTGATGDGLNSGPSNTILIVAAQVNNDASGFFAARLCTDYRDTVDNVIYGGWYLPSKYELNLLFMQREVVGGFFDDYYWSSTEFDYYMAWYQDFNLEAGGYQDYYYKSEIYRIRPIRAF